MDRKVGAIGREENGVDTVCDYVKVKLNRLAGYRVKGFPVGAISIVVMFCFIGHVFVQLGHSIFLELFKFLMALFKVLLKILDNAVKVCFRDGVA